ncbi:MAG: DUF1045 domain-containing protein [Ramlibacter sp.]
MTIQPGLPASERCAAATIRHAVYFAPGRDSPWRAFGASWLGRDEILDAPCPQLASGRSAAEMTALTAEPRRYGFHATLKPPFRLSRSHSSDDLLTRLRQFATQQRRIPLGPLEPAWMDGFVALVPAAASPALQSLAAACVTELDDMRAPATPAERERRSIATGDVRGQELMERYGYPHVLERFRFHMTLTGPVSALVAQDVIAQLTPTVVRLNEQAPLVLDRLCLFVQQGPHAAFRRVADVELPA